MMVYSSVIVHLCRWCSDVVVVVLVVVGVLGVSVVYLLGEFDASKVC